MSVHSDQNPPTAPAPTSPGLPPLSVQPLYAPHQHDQVQTPAPVAQQGYHEQAYGPGSMQAYGQPNGTPAQAYGQPNGTPAQPYGVQPPAYGAPQTHAPQGQPSYSPPSQAAQTYVPTPLPPIPPPGHRAYGPQPGHVVPGGYAPQPVPMRAMAMDAAAKSVPVAAGEVGIGADVSVVWELK